MSVVALACLVVGGLIVTASALLLLGALVPRLPYLGAIGSIVWPTLIGPATLVVLAGLLLVAVSVLAGGGALAAIALVVGLVALAGTLTVLASQIVAARRVGVPIRPGVLVAWGLGPREPEDDSAVYATAPDGSPLRILVYRPRAEGREAAGPAPVVVYVHGGGWFQGAPDENPAMLHWLAGQGYLVLAPQYTLATDERPTWDLAMPQIGCALVWVAEHAGEYGGDPDRVAVWGASAGANLTLTVTYAAAAGRLTLPCAGSLPRIRAVAGEVPAVDPRWIRENPDPIWGARTAEMVTRYIGGEIEDHPERLAAIQVATYLSPDAPPTLLTVSSGDHLVPVGGIREFVEAARAGGVEIETSYRRWGDHVIATIWDGLSSQTLVRQLVRHFRAHGV